MEWQEIILRLLAASLCGMALGIEREIKDRPAGLRTFMLISVGACGFSLVLLSLVDIYESAGEALRVDPSRIVEGIAGGIGFLGAGAIIQGKGEVHGITTGAGVWVAGAIGVACGFGFFILAAALTVLTLFILFALSKVEHLLPKQDRRPR